MQVGVLPEDQRSLCFFWWEDPIREVEVYQYTRHIFGAKDSRPVIILPYKNRFRQRKKVFCRSLGCEVKVLHG